MSEMPLRLPLPRLIWVIMFVTILTGFSVVVRRVSRDYFEYRTVSHITIRDYPQDGIVKAPALEMCVAFDPAKIAMDIRIGDFLSGNYFNYQNDTWRVRHVFGRISKSDKIRYHTKKYIMGSRYCLFVKVLNYFRMAEVAAPHHVIQKRFYWTRISASPIHTKRGLYPLYRKPEKCDPEYVYISLVTDEFTLSNPIKREAVRKACSIGFSYYIIYLTYSSLVTVKLPSPYDSNCFDYRRDGSYLSTHDCYNQCLKDMTKNWNVVPDITLIDKERHNQSEHYFAHGYILEDKQGLKFLKKANISKNLRDAYHALHHEWEGIKRSCRQSCSRPDCWSEDISPNIVQFAGMGSKDKENGSLEYFFPFLILSHQPTIEVLTIPKQNLLDYVIYILSNLSFWLGFCPLAIADTIMKRLQECTRRKKTLEDKVRKNTTRVRNQEERLRILERILTANKEERDCQCRYECDFEPWTTH